jgi:ribosomal protein S18 acetylase RimI-like enzyme
MNTIEVRPVQDNELASVAELLGRLQLATYVGVTPEITEAAMLTHVSGDWAARKEAEFRAKLTEERARMWVAHDGTNVVGFCMASLDRRGGGLGVDPEYQHQKIGLRLVYEAANSVGAEEDFSLTVVPNTPGVTFYEQLGFEPTGRDITSEFPRLRGGEPLPQVEMIVRAGRAQQTLAQLSISTQLTF